jgi:hypothetical protein
MARATSDYKITKDFTHGLLNMVIMVQPAPLNREAV